MEPAVVQEGEDGGGEEREGGPWEEGEVVEEEDGIEGVVDGAGGPFQEAGGEGEGGEGGEGGGDPEDVAAVGGERGGELGGEEGLREGPQEGEEEEAGEGEEGAAAGGDGGLHAEGPAGDVEEYEGDEGEEAQLRGAGVRVFWGGCRHGSIVLEIGCGKCLLLCLEIRVRAFPGGDPPWI